MADAERGKQGALNAFLAERQHLRPQGREEADRLRAEVRWGEGSLPGVGACAGLGCLRAAAHAAAAAAVSS